MPCPVHSHSARAKTPASTGWQDWPSLDRAASGSAEADLARWITDYVMHANPTLGRSGHVCPFVAQASRLNMLRFAISPSPEPSYEEIARLVAEAQDVFDTLHPPKGKEAFRSVIVAFPFCRNPDSIALMRKAQHATRYDAVRRQHMIGLFHPDSPEPGIIDRSFSAFEAPVPLIAVRPLVQQDALFVLRNPPMIPAYLRSFGAQASRKLRAAVTLRLGERVRRIASRKAA